jgi:hypothetical protein
MRIAAVLLLALAFAPQKKGAADVCPWCKNDPALLAASGLLNHGPTAIGKDGSEKLAALCTASKWIFVESAHLRFASSMGDQTVELAERERVERDLARLREKLPSVPVKPKKLDPWLRLHLLVMKSEDFYARFQQLLQVTDADFPEKRQPTGPYMGNGKFLGEADKFEVVLHSQVDNHRRFTESFSGVVVQGALRWHFQEPHKLLVSIPAVDDLRDDRWLTAHVVHNLSHLFLCAYKHFSYNPPIWLDEALALAMEKEIEPTFRTLEGEEGAFRDDTGPKDFAAEARKLLATDKAVRFAALLQTQNFAELGDPGAVTAWSMARFLIEAHPDAFAQFLGRVKGQLDGAGYPTGADLPGLQREALKELWKWTPADLDTAWAAWVMAQAAADDPKRQRTSR